MRTENDEIRDNLKYLTLLSRDYPSQAAAASEAGLAGMLQGSPFKQKYPFDFIIDGESEIVLNVEK